MRVLRVIHCDSGALSLVTCLHSNSRLTVVRQQLISSLPCHIPHSWLRLFSSHMQTQTAQVGTSNRKTNLMIKHIRLLVKLTESAIQSWITPQTTNISKDRIKDWTFKAKARTVESSHKNKDKSKDGKFVLKGHRGPSKALHDTTTTSLTNKSAITVWCHARCNLKACHTVRMRDTETRISVQVIVSYLVNLSLTYMFNNNVKYHADGTSIIRQVYWFGSQSSNSKRSETRISPNLLNLVL